MRRRPLTIVALAAAVAGTLAAAPATAPAATAERDVAERPAVCVKFSPLGIEKRCVEVNVGPVLPFPNPLP